MDKPNLPAHGLPQREDEIFDVVDANDRVVAQATRREVHARGLWHRATHVLVFNSAGKVFLQKRSMRKDSSPGCWDSSCSGHLDSGEDYGTAAVRELGEEIGLVARPEELRFVMKLAPALDTGWEFVSAWVLRHDGPPTINLAEIERGEWFDPGELTRRMAETPSAFTTTLRLHWPKSRLAALGF